MANDHLIIENLLAGTGRRNVELIPQWDPLYLGQVVCGFLNGEGGDVILGINASGEVQGIQSDWTKRINQQIIGKIVPDAPISVTQIPFRSGAVILVSSWSGGRKPYSFRGKIYTTEAGETRLATLSEMKTLNLKRRDSNYHWERQVIPGIEPEELDGYEIRESIESYRKLHPGQPKLSAEDFLFRTGLLKEDGLTNAAVILFSNQPARYLPQCRVRATIYSSEKGGNEIYFDRIFERNLFRNIHSIWDFFDTQLQRSRVISSLKRTDEKLPILALREGLLNALIHRDYSSVSSSVNIEVFPDRLQITNTGDFPPEISTSTLRREHRSILRNPDISYICYLRGYIEMLGTGTLRMISNCESLGYEGPIWEPKPHSIKLIMNGVGHGLKKKIDFRGDKNVGVNVGVNDGEEKNVGVNVGVNDGEEKNVGVNVGVNDGEEKNVGVNVGVNDGEEKNVGINVGVSDGEEKNVGVNVGVNDGEEDNFEKREEKLPETLLSQLVDVFADQAIAESGADRASRNVREKLVQIVAILSRQEGRNSDDLNQEFQKSTRTIERYLKLLKDYGAIEFQGPPKSGGYYLTAEFKAGLPRE